MAKPFKIVNSPGDTGTADIYGGVDIDNMASTLNAQSDFNPYDYYIYKSGANYIAKKGSDATVAFTNTSFYTVITSVIAALSSGGLILLGSGDFSLTSAFATTQSKIKIRGMGPDVTRILFDMANTVRAFQVSGSLGASQNLTVNALEDATTVTIASTTGIAANDWVYLARNVLIDSGATVAYDAEIHQVRSVAATDIVLRDKIYATYNTSATARVNEITFNDQFQLEDLTLYDNRSNTAASTLETCLFLLCKDLRIRNVKFESCIYGSCFLQNCFDSIITDIKIVTPRASSTDANLRNYGLILTSATTNTTIKGLHCTRARHSFTTIPIDSTSQLYHPGRQRNITLNNCVSYNSNVSHFITHEGVVGITFNGCGCIGADVTDGPNTDAKGFDTRSPAIFNGCWTEGDVKVGAYVYRQTIAVGTDDMPGGNRVQFNSCRFSRIHPGASGETNGIFIEGSRSGVDINGCYFYKIPDKPVRIGSGASHVLVNGCTFDSCSANNTSSEGMIHCDVDASDITVTNNDFTAGALPANARPLVGGVITGFTFTGNDVRGMTNEYPSISSTSTFVMMRNNMGLEIIISPTQITGTQTDYSPTDLVISSTLRLDADTSFRRITGITTGISNRELKLVNISANAILLNDQNNETASIAGNRFDFGGYDIPLFPTHVIQLWYDSTTSRWRAVNTSNFVTPPANWGYYYHRDGLGGNTADGVTASTAASGGTHSSINGDIKHPGLQRYTAGTSTTGFASNISAANVLRLGNSNYWRFDAMINIDTLSDATNTYTLRAGFIDSGSAESVDGAFFRYTHSVNTGKWVLVGRSNSVETVTNATNTAVAAATRYRLTVIVNAAGNEAKFFQDGVSLGTVTTNIPTGSGRETGFGVMFLKSAGTTDINILQFDSMQVIGYFNTAR